jgi:hypothetical protein
MLVAENLPFRNQMFKTLILKHFLTSIKKKKKENRIFLFPSLLIPDSLSLYIFYPNKQSSVNLVQKTWIERINQSVVYELLRAD